MKVKCNEKFTNLMDIDIVQEFGGVSYEARYDMIEWDKERIESWIKEALHKVILIVLPFSYCLTYWNISICDIFLNKIISLNCLIYLFSYNWLD